jgi:hypothetical protein
MPAATGMKATVSPNSTSRTALVPSGRASVTSWNRIASATA